MNRMPRWISFWLARRKSWRSATRPAVPGIQQSISHGSRKRAMDLERRPGQYQNAENLLASVLLERLSEQRFRPIWYPCVIGLRRTRKAIKMNRIPERQAQRARWLSSALTAAAL